MVGSSCFHLERVVPSEGLRAHGILAPKNSGLGALIEQRYGGLLDHGDAASGRRFYGMRLVGGQMGKSARNKLLRLATHNHRYRAFQRIEKALAMGRPERTSRLELRRVLGEGGSDGRRRMHSNGYRIETGEGDAHKSIRRLQQMGGLAVAAGMSQVIHAECFAPYRRVVHSNCQSCAKMPGRRPVHFPHPQDEPTRRDGG